MTHTIEHTHACDLIADAQRLLGYEPSARSLEAMRAHRLSVNAAGLRDNALDAIRSAASDLDAEAVRAAVAELGIAAALIDHQRDIEQHVALGCGDVLNAEIDWAKLYELVQEHFTQAAERLDKAYRWVGDVTSGEQAVGLTEERRRLWADIPTLAARLDALEQYAARLYRRLHGASPNADPRDRVAFVWHHGNHDGLADDLYQLGFQRDYGRGGYWCAGIELGGMPMLADLDGGVQ